MTKPRLAFVCPLPPVRSGIADYAADLLPLVARDFAVECFVDDRHPLAREGRFGSIPVHPASELRRCHREFAHVVYQLGNNLHHRFVLELAAEIPGVAVLHDLVLHHLYEEIVGREDAWERYGEALRESYGADGALVLRAKQWRLASEAENFALPLFESLAARSRGVLVHSHNAAREVARRLPQVPVARMPMGIPPSPPTVDVGAARGRLGVAPADVVVASFGFLIPTKRIDVVAIALREARRRCPELRLVLIGEESPGFRLSEAFRPEELADGSVMHRGYVTGEEYREWMAAADVAVNLRYPTAGETSASLLRLLGDGQCTLVSAYRQFLELPEDAVVRIPLGAEEVPTLVRELVALARDPERRRRIGEAARRFVAAEHSMEAAARAFRAAVERFAAATPKPPAYPLWRMPKTSRSATIRGSVAAAAAGEIRRHAGAPVDLDFTVRNEGSSRWIATPEPFGGHVAIGADLLDGDGAFVARLRSAPLPRDLEPGAETRVRFRFEAPASPGRYGLRPLLAHVGRSMCAPAGAPIPLIVTIGGG